MNNSVKILETDKGVITKIDVRGVKFSVGDETELGKIREFFTSGDVIWVGMTRNQEFKARLLQQNKTKK